MKVKRERPVLRRVCSLLGLFCCLACEPKVTIPVAAQDLAEGAILDGTMVIGLKVARSGAPSTWAGAVEPLYGKRLRIPLRRGDPILSASFSDDSPLSSTIMHRGRGFSLSIFGAEEARINDHVDLLGVVRNPSADEGQQVVVLAQNVFILSLGEFEPAAQDRGESPRRATLLLTPQEGEIALLAAHNGELHVALRNPGDFDGQEETRFAADILFSGQSVKAHQHRVSRTVLIRAPTLPGPPVDPP